MELLPSLNQKGGEEAKCSGAGSGQSGGGAVTFGGLSGWQPGE